MIKKSSSASFTLVTIAILGQPPRPILAFALCYVAAHLAIDLLKELQAEDILVYCEKHLDELEIGA
jgi:hypothetical protein